MVIQLQQGGLGEVLQAINRGISGISEQRMAKQKKLEDQRILDEIFGTSQSPVTPEPLSRMAQPNAETVTIEDKVSDKSSAPGVQRISDEQLVKLTMLPKYKDVANAELKRREIERKTFESDRKFHSEGSKKGEERAFALRESLPKKQSALNLARDSVQSGEVGPFSLANLAERTGIPEFQTAKGSQLVTAAKENLLSNMARVSAKAQNIWFEQRLNSMFPKIGQTIEANEAAGIMLQGELDMDNNWLEEYNRISKEDMDRYGYVRRDAEQRATELADRKNQEVMNKTSYQLRRNFEDEKGARWMQDNAKKSVVQGTPLTPEMFVVMLKETGGDKAKAIANAKKRGYKIHTQEEIREWLQ